MKVICQKLPFFDYLFDECVPFYPLVDSIAFTDELSRPSVAAVATPDSVEKLLDGVKLLLSEALVQQVGACFQFDVSSEDGQHRSYYVDLSQGDG